MARKLWWDRVGSETRWEGRIYRTNGRIWNIDANQTYAGTQNGASQGDGDSRTPTDGVLYLAMFNLSGSTFSATSPTTDVYEWGQGIAATESFIFNSVSSVYTTTSLVARTGTPYSTTYGPLAASSISKPSTMDVLPAVNAPTFSTFPYSNFKSLYANGGTGSGASVRVAGPATLGEVFSDVRDAGIRAYNFEFNTSIGSLRWYLHGGTHGARTWTWSNWGNAPVSYPASGGIFDFLNFGLGQRTGLHWAKVSNVLVLAIADFNSAAAGPQTLSWFSNPPDFPATGDVGSTGWVVASHNLSQPGGTRPNFTDGEVVYLSTAT